MENNGLDRHSTPEKVTAIVIIFALLLFPAKLIYYDTGGINAFKIIFPVILIGIAIALAIFKDVRNALFEKWLRMMLYAPILIIILIVVGIIVYFFQVIFQAGPLDGGAGE
ncbi:hypothetical protein BEL04_17585 [Mucilaginibacter sp. PPCGB 2223]|uniref:hypothetical protein n=1 Tax=Mucilaginibacter sp. PPCGB 2223 TaxID=1886027 RepID=UPI000824C9B0|nr:hypothetical protein [Mucilaginibacter sp. PPCGB 2223]OCX51823.1 hypothetical protein BEL04_17585 [Mucilaginibacter sp. PPCGB 2223]